MIALRASAILSILVSALYIHGAFLALHAAGPDPAILVMLVGVLVPLVSGLSSLFGRATALLPAAWGWQLGVHLPKLLVTRPEIPPDLARTMHRDGGSLYVIGPDYFGMAICAVAIVGLGLYLFAYYRRAIR